MLAPRSSGCSCGSTHGFTLEFEPVCVVHEAVQYRVGVGRIVYSLMPASHGKLAGDERWTLTVAVLEDFTEMMPGVAIEWLKTSYVDGSRLVMAERTF